MSHEDISSKGACAPFFVPELSVVIPVHNQWRLTRSCIDSLFTFPPDIPFEIIVVDDGSIDETVENVQAMASVDRRIRLVQNPPPHRFARACNCGANVARGELLLFLNNDVEAVVPGWFRPLKDLLRQQTRIGIVAPRLLFPNNTIQHCGKLWSLGADGLPRNEHYLYEQPAELPKAQRGGEFLTVTGACILVRREQFLRIGPFDERYENGWEDDDICLAYREQGFISWVSPKSTLIHHQGGTLKSEAAVLERYIAILNSKNLRLDGNDPLLENLMQRIREKSERFEAAWQTNRQLFAAKWGQAVQRCLVQAVDAAGAATIVIVTYNSAVTITACLQSVLGTLRPGDRLVLVDNNSCDATCSIVDGVADADKLQFVKNNQNLGFSIASNQGIRLAKTPFVVLLNPDTVVTTGWLDRLNAHFVDDHVAAVGPVSNFAAGRQSVVVHWQGQLPQSMAPDQAAAQLYGMNHGRQEESRLLIGFCLMLRRTILMELGGLDERLFLGNDDLELSWRLRLHGHRLVIATDTFVWHEGQHSFKTVLPTTTGQLVQESTDALYSILAAHYGLGRVPTPEELWGIDWFSPTEAQYNASVTFHQALSKPRAWESPQPKDAQPLVSIIVLTFNQWVCTEECLAAIKRHTPEPYELIIVDNGSSDGTPERLKLLAATDRRLRLLLNIENRGYAAGCNQGICQASGEYILLLNNDVVVTPEWLSGLLECYIFSVKTGVVGPLTNSASGIQVVPEPDYAGAGGLDRFARQFRISHRFRKVPSRRVAGFCMLFKRALLDEIGMLDEQFGTGNYEDDDICLRAAVAGYQNMVAADVFVHHHGSMTFKGNNIDYRSALARNAALFHHKWSKPVYDPVAGRQISACRTLEHVEQLYWDEQFDQAALMVNHAVAEHPDDLRLLQLKERIRQAVNMDCISLLQVAQARAEHGSEYADALLIKAFVLEPWHACLQHAIHELAKTGKRGLVSQVDEAFRLYPLSRALARLRVELAALEDCPNLLAWAESFLATFGFDERVIQVGLRQRHRLGPYQQAAPAGKSVALCMIVKDEEQHLARCLASCKPVVHEIIVVDTGSTDHTAQIAELFGAKLLSCKWMDDFSSARNCALESADADWVLVMDADEVLSPRDYPLFAHLLAGAASDRAYIMTTRNYTLNSGYEGFIACQGEYPEVETAAGWTPSDKIRIFPNHRGIRFNGAIHEMVEDSVRLAGFAMIHHPVPVHHYGELKQVNNKSKKEQYLALGVKKLGERPADPKAIYELAVQAAELEQYETAEQLWRILLSKQPDFARGWFNLGFALLRQGKLQESVAASENALRLDPAYTDALVNKSISVSCLFAGEEAFMKVMETLKGRTDNPTLLGLMALAYYRVGRPAEGEEILRNLKLAGISCAQLYGGIYQLMKQAAHTDLAWVKQALDYSSSL